jgi:hypothetical protein
MQVVAVEQHTTQELAALVVLVLVEMVEMDHPQPKVEMEQIIVEEAAVGLAVAPLLVQSLQEATVAQA